MSDKVQRYEYVTITTQAELAHKRPYYFVTNNRTGDRLAQIYYYPQWRQYVWQALPDCIFSKGCTKDILDFMQNHAGKDI